MVKNQTTKKIMKHRIVRENKYKWCNRKCRGITTTKNRENIEW